MLCNGLGIVVGCITLKLLRLRRFDFFGLHAGVQRSAVACPRRAAFGIVLLLLVFSFIHSFTFTFIYIHSLIHLKTFGVKSSVDELVNK